MTVSAPRRIQRRRIAGWTAPLDPQGRRPVYVGRNTRWGSPWVAIEAERGWEVARDWRGGWEIKPTTHPTREAAHKVAVDLYRAWLEVNADLTNRARDGLAGRTLMCWCAEDAPCHADVLLDIANRVA